MSGISRSYGSGARIDAIRYFVQCFEIENFGRVPEWRGPRSDSTKSRMGMSRPLEGFKVVEVAMWAFVPSCGGALCDMGADVIKVEPPSGDPLRGLQIGGMDKSKVDLSWEATTAASARSRSTSRWRKAARC
jgi:hypothetical protein